MHLWKLSMKLSAPPDSLSPELQMQGVIRVKKPRTDRLNSKAEKFNSNY